VLKEARQGAADEIYKLYSNTSSTTYHQKRIDELNARIAAKKKSSS
jgi:hypothetical protein